MSSSYRLQTEILPIFPPELEREIFRTTALTYRHAACRLVLVARRVQIWIEPIIYEVVILSRRQSIKANLFLRTTMSRSPSFFATHVKSLCLTNHCIPVRLATHILSLVAGVQDLAFWFGHKGSLLSALTCRPRRLSLRIQVSIFNDSDMFAYAVFSKVTHLTLIDENSIFLGRSAVMNLPCLTHLALNFSLSHYYSIDAHRVAEMLSLPSSLVILMLFLDGNQDIHVVSELLGKEIDDKRWVLTRVYPDEDAWASGARGGRDIWTIAEEGIAKRNLEDLVL